MSFLKNIRVAVRLPFVVVLALVALLVFAITSLTTLSTLRVGGPKADAINEQNTLLADILPPPAYLVETELAAMELRSSAEAGDAEGIAEAKADITELAALFEERHAFWQATLGDGPQQQLLDDVHTTGMAYIDVLRGEMLPAVDANDSDAIAAAETKLDALFTEHRAAVDAAAAATTAEATAATEAGEGLAKSRSTMLLVLLVVTLIVVGAASVVVTMSVLRPLDELRKNMDEIASGDGTNAADARLDAARKDEFGDVATAFNAFADKLSGYSSEVARNAADAQARTIEVTEAAGVAADNMQQVAVATTELSAAASEIARSAGDASRVAETAVRAADHANELMQRLADSSARIGEVVESIRGIAAQTTMLALNATIEAARAGEAGRGFAVVASEVKDLAAETGTATADIVGRVEAIHGDTQAALVALGEVAQVITEISSTQSVIAAAVEEQAATTAEIDRSLTEAVTAVNQLAAQTAQAPSFATAA